MHSHIILEKGMPLAKSEKAIIFLHGRGGSAEDIIQLKREFGNERFHYAAPQAANNTWYPYPFLSPVTKNEPWLTSAVEIIKRLSDDISSIIGYENLYIMGFSQGACLALESSSRFAKKYGGIAAFTGGLIGDSITPEIYSGNFEGTKVFIGNSDDDPHVPVKRSEESKELMESLGAEVTLAIYPGMSHIISPEEIEAVKKLMNL
ncbi:MAG TPA: dienelactone hydrolase family protein [Bacteroidales bacterium]|jgi:phospholipase/carboxylesterase|nr:dienelactone hydrolase family protein [Bacteroidales bacterium]